MSFDERFNRNELLFGYPGQHALKQTSVAIVGLGGVGSVVAHHAAFLGVGRIILVDGDLLARSNRNRLFGVFESDEDGVTPKVDIARRAIENIDSSIDVAVHRSSVCSADALGATKEAAYVMGCLDHDGPRLALTHLCCAYGIPYIDSATDVSDGVAGGRIVSLLEPPGCLMCLGELDRAAIDQFYAGSSDVHREDIYGVNVEALDEAGPSVSTVNGVVASLAATLLMNSVTGLAKPARFLEFRADSGIVVRNTDRAAADCYYCRGQWGVGDAADTEQYQMVAQP